MSSIKLVVYLPVGVSSCYAIHIPEDAAVEKLIDAIRDHTRFKHRLRGEDPLLFKYCEPREPKGTCRERVLNWLGTNADDAIMDDLDCLKKYFPEGPLSKTTSGIIDIVVATDSILEGLDEAANIGPCRKRPRSGEIPMFGQLSLDWNPDNSAWVKETEKSWRSFLCYWQDKQFDIIFNQEIIPLAYDKSGIYDPSHRLPCLTDTNGQFLVLESYRKLFERVCNYQQKNPASGVLLTGQPGIGKTTWLWFLLICLIMKHESVAFYFDGKVHLFHQGCVYLAKNKEIAYLPPRNISESPVWCLLDSDYTTNPPPTFLVSKYGRKFPVQASSPNEGRYDIWIKQRGGVRWGLPLWSEEELWSGFKLHTSYAQLHEAYKRNLDDDPSGKSLAAELALKFAPMSGKDVIEACGIDQGNQEQAVENVMKELLHHLIEEYGPINRDVYSAITRVELLKQGIQEALDRVSLEDLVKALRFMGKTNPTLDRNSPSHNLIAIMVKEGSDGTHDSFVPRFRSDTIGKEVIERLGHLRYQQAWQLLDVYRSLPQSSVLANWIFEGLAHNFSASGNHLYYNMDYITRLV